MAVWGDGRVFAHQEVSIWKQHAFTSCTARNKVYFRKAQPHLMEAELRRWTLLSTAEPVLFFWQITQDPLPHFNAYFFIFRIKHKGDSCSPLLLDILISCFRALLGREKNPWFDYISSQKSISLWNFQLAEVA